MVAMLSASSLWPYMPDMPMQPSARGNTKGPVAPSCRREVMRASYPGSFTTPSVAAGAVRAAGIRLAALPARAPNQPRERRRRSEHGAERQHAGGAGLHRAGGVELDAGDAAGRGDAELAERVGRRRAGEH